MNECPDVVVLGAGFSRAISQHMPLTDELGRAAVKRAGLAGDPRIPASDFRTGFTFEEWLSLLADDQPQLSEAENRRNGAVFAQLKEALADELATAEARAIDDGAPEWLYDLLSVFHYHQTTVITFNYDTLIEVGVETQRLVGGFPSNPVRPIDVLRDSPPLPGLRPGPVQPSFRLLKLHGSIDWWWVPGDATGATLNREDHESTFGNYRRLSEEARRQFLPGREPFIVPPSATKSMYYRTPLTRELWRSGAEALNGASHVSFVGYSLPPPDLVMSGMVQRAVAGGAPRIEVVNLDPSQPVARLVGLGAHPDSISVISGPTSVAGFATAICERASLALVEEFRRRNPEGAGGVSLFIAWDDPRTGTTGTRRVTGVPTPGPGGIIELALDRHPPTVGDATAARFSATGGPSQELFASLADLISCSRGASGIAVRVADGRLVPIVGARQEFRQTGANNRWVALVPAGREPR